MSVLTPLADDYEAYDKAKCVLDSSTEGGHILFGSVTRRAWAGNSGCTSRPRSMSGTRMMGRCLIDQRIHRDWPKTTRSAGTRLIDAARRHARRGRLLRGRPAAEVKAADPLAALDEALEYLVKNTFNKMGYLKRLSTRAAEGNPGRPAQ